MNKNVRHFTTREILRCVRSHGGSRLTYTDEVRVPGTKMRRTARYTFCGECSRHVRHHPTCDGCGRREDAYVIPIRPSHIFYVGVVLGWLHAWTVSVLSARWTR